jgi:hypothetical protein
MVKTLKIDVCKDRIFAMLQTKINLKIKYYENFRNSKKSKRNKR